MSDADGLSIEANSSQSSSLRHPAVSAVTREGDELFAHPRTVRRKRCFAALAKVVIFTKYDMFS